MVLTANIEKNLDTADDHVEYRSKCLFNDSLQGEKENSHAYIPTLKRIGNVWNPGGTQYIQGGTQHMHIRGGKSDIFELEDSQK